jgi:carbon-monoxide dehydrogenase large subunit
VVRYVAVDDCGVVINPMIVEGQVHGGVTQGIAEALFEEAIYDETGNLTTSTMTNYLVPSAAEVPAYVLDRRETASTTNPMGVKGIGEAGTIAAPPAVVNAVIDAVSHLGVTEIQKPATPERVWRAIQRAKVEGRPGASGAGPGGASSASGGGAA